MKYYDNAYYSDCRFCIYSSLCYGISGKSGKRGKLADLKCIIKGWKTTKKEGSKEPQQ